MKIKNFIKPFLTTKIDLVSSQVLSAKKNSEDSILIANIYYDSGVEKSVFAKLYLATATRYFSKVSDRPSEMEVLNSIREALRVRRFCYLPDGVCAEDVHGLKDVWTFATFLAGLLLPLEGVSNEKLLKRILEKQVILWLEKKGVMGTLLDLKNTESGDLNVHTLRGFYKRDCELDNVEELTSVIMDEKQREIESVVLSKPTNREVGELCLKWLFRHAEIGGKVAYIKDDMLIVKSPMAFIEYAKESDFTWKSAQKGLIKLGRHQPNEENGTPFHKIGNTNVLVLH